MIKTQKQKRCNQSQISNFIQKQIRKSRIVYICNDDLFSEGWTAYLEARYNYAAVQGCCNFQDYVEFCIAQRFSELKILENARFSLESKLSLDKKTPSGESIGACFFRQNGDFTNSVVLWEYMGDFTASERFVASGMCKLDSHEEIKADGGFSESEYRYIVTQLQEKFEDWKNI